MHVISLSKDITVFGLVVLSLSFIWTHQMNVLWNESVHDSGVYCFDAASRRWIVVLNVRYINKANDRGKKYRKHGMCHLAWANLITNIHPLNNPHPFNISCDWISYSSLEDLLEDLLEEWGGEFSGFSRTESTSFLEKQKPIFSHNFLFCDL